MVERDRARGRGLAHSERKALGPMDPLTAPAPTRFVPEGARALLIPSDNVRHFRRMLREQLAGDAELIRDLADGRESHGPDREDVREVACRLSYLRQLSEEVGLF
jgi:hypothetical protein